MQIHELTRRRRTDEGILDNIKATGQTLAKGYQQGGLKGALKAGTSNQAFMATQTANKIARETDAYARQLATAWQSQADRLLAGERATARKSPGGSSGAETNAAAEVGRKVSRARPGQMSARVAASPTGQKLQKMFGAPRGGLQDIDSDLEEAFTDLPGAKPTEGNTPQVYKQAFERWANDQLTTHERNSGETLNLATVKAEPGYAAQLKTALDAVVNSRADNAANQEAVKNYLVLAMKGLQQIAARKRAENPRGFYSGGGRSSVAKRSVPGRMDPETEQMAAAMGITYDNLKKMRSIVQNNDERVDQGTGSKTIDNMLVASGLLRP